MEVSSATAALIATIGTPAFADALHAAMREAIEVDLCSAFAIAADGARRLLVAAGRHPRIPGFAREASLDYAEAYWRSDREGVRARGLTAGGLRILRQAATEIRDPLYRYACYERGGIAERITLHAPHVGFLVSGYRLAERGPGMSAEIERLEAIGPILIAALTRHVELADADGQAAAVRFFTRHPAGLSRREARICADIALALPLADIARCHGLSVTSVITYRRRAYTKLGVSGRGALTRLYREATAVA